MNNAVHANAPAITLADVDCKKIPGCSTNCVILVAAAEIPAAEDDIECNTFGADVVLIISAILNFFVSYEYSSSKFSTMIEND